MSAVFPRGVKSFPKHRNLVDDVRAEHINNIQDEIVALESVLGPLVTQVSEIRADVDQIRGELDVLTGQVRIVEATIRDQQSQIDQHTADINNLQAQIDALVVGQEALRLQLEQDRDDIIALQNDLIDDRALNDLEHKDLQDQILNLMNLLNDHKKKVVIEFANVDERLNYMSEGKHIYATEVRRSEDLSIKKSSGSMGLPNPKNQTLIRMSDPTGNGGRDPMGMYDGVGITIPVSGFWFVQGYVQISTGGGPGNAQGAYYAEVRGAGSVGGHGADRYFVDNTIRDNLNDVVLTPSYVGWFPSGSKFLLYAAHSATKNQTLTHAKMTAFRVRGY